MDIRRLADYDALLLTAAIWFLAKFLRYAFPPLFEPLQATYGISNAAVGTAFTGLMLTYAAMQFPSGVLADRVGSVRVITGGVLLASLGAFAVVLGGPFVLLAATMVVIGAGTGAHKTVAVRLLSGVYPARTGRALGILDTIGAFGGIAAPAAVAALLATATLGWRVLFVVGGGVGVALAALFYIRLRHRVGDDVSPDAERESAGARAYLAPFRELRFSVFVLVTVCYSFAYNGAVAFLPLYLTREAGLEPAVASLLYGVLFAASLVQLMTGTAADRVGPLPIITGCLALAGVALGGVLALPATAGVTSTVGIAAIGAAVLGVGLGSHGFRPVRDTYLVEIIPDAHAGGILGVVRTILMAAGATSPAVVGYLADTAGFRPAFLLLTASFGVGSVVAGWLWFTDE
ncbi:MFS transporter [Haloparvum sp. AD34]